MAQETESIEGITISADSLEEAATFVVGELQRLTEARGARGFNLPTLTRESFELVDGAWVRVFEFASEFLVGGA